MSTQNMGWLSIVISMLLFSVSVTAQQRAATGNQMLEAQFTSTPIIIDGVVDPVWSRTTPSPIGNAYNVTLSGPATNPCPTSGDIRAMWDGAVLYLLVTITDPLIATTDAAITNKDGVEFWIDHFNDKVAKFEEDDGMMTISAPPTTFVANRPQNTVYNNVTSRYLKSYASSNQMDASGNVIGYNVEIAWYLGEHGHANGSTFGFDIGINEVNNSNTRQCRVFWNTASKNRTTDNNIEWGTVVLAGYDGHAAMQLDTFMLRMNIEKANALVRGIWVDELALDKALAIANVAMKSSTQAAIDSAHRKLDAALRGLRRSGPYPDPQDLPATFSLNDPFAFFDGSRVKALTDWNKRREEIKSLAQYYEFGIKPPKPAVLMATSITNNQSRDITINMTDHGRDASFTSRLTLPTAEQAAASGKSAPYPVVVSLDFAVSNGNAIYLNAGYAVLSIPTGGVQSDNVAHTGAIFDLYPYDVKAGHDFGCLMGWAWGASRAVDALEYLLANDSSYKANGSGVSTPLIDLSKLAVTGFSRWGKGALTAGFLDERFKVTAPGASGSGGAAPYRYVSFGHEYTWDRSPGSEVLGDHMRHQTHNSNEMMRRFLNDEVPATAQGRMYKRSAKATVHGYGERLPYDHHLLIAAIAPRAVFIYNTNDDYGNNAEGDAIGYEGAKPVFEYLGATDKLALDIYMGGGGHAPKLSQLHNLVRFMDYVLYGVALPNTVPSNDATNSPTDIHLHTDPYLNGALAGKSVYDTYFGGFNSMMPWLGHMPRAVNSK